MNIKKKILISLLMTGLVFVFTGALFASPEIVLDTEKHVMYQNFTADEVVKAFSANKDTAESKFDNNKVAVLGKVSSLSVGNMGLELGTLDSRYISRIDVTTLNFDVMDSIKGLNIGDTVLVYGEVSGGLFGTAPTMYADFVERSDEGPKNEMIYSVHGGRDMDISNVNAYSVGKKVVFTAPASWKAVSHDMIKEGLGSIPGYQFRLNEIRGSQTTDPESLFVCYFNNDLLKNAGDKAETNLIEEAIIKNILKKNEISKFPIKKETTYYGAKYQYFQDAYQDKLGNGYHMEFAFEANGTDGILVYLYVYKTPVHIDEVMSVMRFLKLK